MMNKIVSAAAAFSLIVAASPALALFPDIPVAPDAYHGVSAKAADSFEDKAVTNEAAARMNLGWEAAGALPPGAVEELYTDDFYDGLTFPGDIREGQNAAVDIDTDMPI